MNNYTHISLFCLALAILIIVLMIGCEEEATEPTKEVTSITISPEGGNYSFPDGIILKVPAGAVSENKNIMLKKVSSVAVTPIFDKRGVPIENLLACIEGTPDGTTFDVPVQLYLNVDLEPGEIPIIHEVNIGSGSYTPAEIEVIADPDQDTLIISLTHFSAFTAESMKEYEELLDQCGDTPCRCGKIKVEQHDKDYLCDNGDCQVSETQVTVTFLECPGNPTEESTMREVSEGCSPELHLLAASPVVSTGGQTRVSAYVELGCEPTEGQSVDFSLSNTSLATVNPTYASTDASGEAHTTFQAGEEEGLVTVTARSTVSYYTYTISASAGEVHETANGDLITAELNESVDIEIQEPAESWSGNISFNIFVDYVIKEYANYEVNFQFFVTDIGDSSGRSIDGTATATQDVTLGIGHECYTYKDLDAPATLELIVSGYIPPNSDTLTMSLVKDENHTEFYKYVTCFVCDPLNPDNCGDPDGVIISMLIGNPYTGDKGTILLQEGTYSSSYDVLFAHETYTITLNKDEPSKSYSLKKKDSKSLRSDVESVNRMKSAMEFRKDKISKIKIDK